MREIVTWELAQKYFLDPTFGGALVPGQRNVFTTTADFTGIAFLNEARRLSPLISRLRFQATNRTEAEWDIDYDFKNSRINASTAFVNYRVGPYTIGGGDCLPASTQQPRSPSSSPTGLQSVPGACSATDIPTNADSAEPPISDLTPIWASCSIQPLQLAYNWDCCGLSVEYRRFALGSVRNENQFRFNFALANIGLISANLRQAGEAVLSALRPQASGRSSASLQQIASQLSTSSKTRR